MRLLLFPALLCTLASLHATRSTLAQTAAAAHAAVAAAPSVAAFSAEPYILKTASTVTDMNADGTGTRVQTFAIVVQSEAALRQFEVVSLAYPSQSEKAEIVYARVVHADGTVQETPASAAIEQPAPVTQQAPFYSDIKMKQLPIRSLRLGDTLEWQARFTIEHPEAPGQFWGQESLMKGPVILDQNVELRVPAEKAVTVWTNPRAGIHPVESQADGKRIYRWQTSRLKPTVGSDAEAAKLAEEKRIRTPEEELDATKGELPTIAWTSFPDWAAVGAWYHALSADRAIPDATVKAKVAELTAGKTTEAEKARAVYFYVSTQIRYIGVAFGIGRYQPHTAAEVLANQYGDCKDKHTLLAAMLSAMNVPADAVLVGAGVRFNPAVPSPAAFNHLITRVSLDGKPVFLDATAEVGAWGSLLNVIRDQDALVIPPAGPAAVMHTPVDLPHPQQMSLKVEGALDDSLTSESKMTLTFHDDTELYLRAALHSVSPADYGTFVQAFVSNLGFGGTTSSPEIDHLDDPSQPLVLSFHYHRVKEKDWGDNRITASFTQIGVPGFAPDKPPVMAIQLGAPRTESSTVEMKLPKGWSAERPEEVHAKTPYVTCDVTYELKDGTLYAHRTLVVLKKQVPLADYKQYQTWYDDSGASGVPYIQLTPPVKAGAAATAVVPAAPEKPGTVPASDAKAHELVMKGVEAIRMRDLDAGRQSLDEARAINPTEEGLWVGYGMLGYLLGKQTEAMNDMQHELTYHPDEVQYYFPVAQQQQRNGDTDGAVETLRSWVKAAPDSVKAWDSLAGTLEQVHRHDEALGQAQAGLKRLAGSDADLTPLRLVAANAKVSLGRQQEAAEDVAPLLAKTTDPALTNDIAYVLAEAGSHLPEAEAAQTKVIAQLEAETTDWTLTQDRRPLFNTQQNLAADWDTLGWILYKEQRYPEALGYFEAALRTRQNSVVTEHLAATLTAMHRAPDHRNELERRTYSLGAANGRHGVASFALLIADGKVVSSDPEQNDSSTPKLPDADKLLERADLHALTPPGSKAHLVRTGFVNCVGSRCELVLGPVQ